MSSIVVDPNGTIRLIYEDDLRGLLQVGQGKVTRASHVEPTVDGRWTADMMPVNGPVLGPFDTRAEALTKEIAYLTEYVL